MKKIFKKAAGAIIAGAFLCIGMGIGMVNAYAVEINGYGIKDSPYIIQNEEQLLAMVSGELPLDAYYKLNNNIALTTENWTPIGAFSGSFDGNDYTISNLNIESNAAYVGLFSQNDGVIKNLKVRAVSINETVESKSCVGVIAGCNTKTITNCSVLGDMSCTYSSYYSYVGGITGYNSGELTDCRSACAFTGISDYIGGITAYSTKTGSITGCEFTGSIGDELTYCNVDMAGGIVGWSGSDITECANEGNIKARGDYAGGLCGNADNCDISLCYSVGNVENGGYNGCKSGVLIGGMVRTNVSNCFAVGSVTNASGKSGDYAGGLVGRVYSSLFNGGNIKNCYSSCEVKGEGAARAFAENVNGTVSDCYYNSSAAGEVGDEYALALSEEQMTEGANFASWDFENVWAIDADVNNGLPYLRALPNVVTLNGGSKCMQYGDVNLDGKLTAADCSVILSKVLNDAYIMLIEQQADAANIFYGDVNADNRLTAADSSVLLQKVLNDAYIMPVE